jgi:hypothetical protein
MHSSGYRRLGQLRLSSIVNLLKFAAMICGQFEVASLSADGRRSEADDVGGEDADAGRNTR